MAFQRDPNTIRITINLTIDDAAKLRTYLRGKKVPAQKIGGRNIRKSMRDMRPSDFFLSCGRDILTRAVSVLHPEDREWARKKFEIALRQRKKQDAKVASGAYRKPPEQHLKPGRKAGVHYPAYDAALRKRGSAGKKNITKKTKGN